MTTYATTRAVSRTAGRDKITVDGVDVTNFRDFTTPTPRYMLTEPFAYGATSLEFPQVHAGYERPGLGDLTWARAGARVVISRTFDSDPEIIDYRGVVIAVSAAGRALSLDVGGQVSGPASLLQRQNQMFRYTGDVGRWAARGASDMGVSFTPHGGPVTGIQITHAGGQSHLSWMQYVGAMSQDANGIQRAFMPTTWGSSTWTFVAKNYTTKHLTVYNDDARAVLNVIDDASEAPNVIYGTGITPDGERITNAKWPGVFAGPAPDYPMAGGAAFGIGTVDGDTINGDGISVLDIKLAEMGYQSYNTTDSVTYDTAMSNGVKKLQADAGLSQTGTMTTAAWNALFDNNVTGFSINGAYIAPLAEATAVRKYNRTSNGSIAGLNPNYDPTVLRVEQTLDFGSGITKAAMIAYARGVIARSTALKNWTGTLRLNGTGAFTGEHDGTDAGTLTEADMMPMRDIRPGMNVWLPLFDGGTLFHIAGVEVDGDGVTLTIDTQARDMVEVSAILARDADSRRDIRREWMAQNRDRKPSTGMVACDEGFGYVDRKIHLKGGQWNVFPVIGGQHGQVNRVQVDLVNDAPEFAISAWRIKMTTKRAARLVGNPLVVAAESVWERQSLRQMFRDRKLLYAVGDGKQPCGYFPRRHRNDDSDVTDAPITGEHLDDSTWTYYHAAHTAVIIYVAIYPDRDCVLKKGRILYPQLDDTA